jgi:hypothetical protein
VTSRAPPTLPAYVKLDDREVIARPWLPRGAYVGTCWTGPTGEAVLVEADGTASPWPPKGLRSIASAPAPRPRRP